MASSFEATIAILKVAWAQSEEAKAKFMTIYPDLQDLAGALDVAGTTAENASDLIKSAMGDITPKELEDAKLLIMANGVTAVTTKIVIEGAMEKVQDCIAQMNEASTKIQTYIGKIS